MAKQSAPAHPANTAVRVNDFVRSTMKTINTARAINQESAEWLANNNPVYYDAIAADIELGATPDEIYRYVVRETSRNEIALRCRQAAAHMVMKMADGGH